MADPLEAFVRAAHDFCDFVTTAETLTLIDRLHRARTVLLALYMAATKLRTLSNADTTTDEQAPAISAPERWPGFAEHDVYWEVFDPYEHTEPLNGTLSDDFLDVYRDVSRGLWFWEKNERPNAVWEWNFSFESHWGDHAIDALRALHRACTQATRAL